MRLVELFGHMKLDQSIDKNVEYICSLFDKINNYISKMHFTEYGTLPLKVYH